MEKIIFPIVIPLREINKLTRKQKLDLIDEYLDIARESLIDKILYGSKR